jgi:hypothetical protein
MCTIHGNQNRTRETHREEKKKKKKKREDNREERLYGEDSSYLSRTSGTKETKPSTIVYSGEITEIPLQT